MFISEFEEVCAMLKIQQLTEDAVKLRFIPFALKDNAKKWLYSLNTNLITTWEEFVTIFLKKYFPHHKKTKIRNEINQFHQAVSEPFWRYLERFKDLLAQCSHHAIEKWRLCQIIYEGVEYNSKPLFESMSHGDFMSMNEDDAWKFLEDIAEKTMKWEGFKDKPTPSAPVAAKRGGAHSLETSIVAEAKIAALTRKVEELTSHVLEAKGSKAGSEHVNQLGQSCCWNCQGTNHVIEECPFMPNQLESTIEQMNATFQR